MGGRNGNSTSGLALLKPQLWIGVVCPLAFSWSKAGIAKRVLKSAFSQSFGQRLTVFLRAFYHCL